MLDTFEHGAFKSDMMCQSLYRLLKHLPDAVITSVDGLAGAEQLIMELESVVAYCRHASPRYGK